MKDFGLVVIGAHFGVWLEQEISKYSKQDIILVEPVPYNIDILEKKYSSFKNITICKNAIFSENKVKSFYFVDENSITKLSTEEDNIFKLDINENTYHLTVHGFDDTIGNIIQSFIRC